MQVTLDHAGGVALLQRGGWRHSVAFADLARWLALSKDLAARGARKGKSAGPWAEFYEADVVALTAACREIAGGGNGP